MNTSLAMINELLSHVNEGSYVLEPSAGDGSIAIRLSVNKKCKVDCIELNEYKANVLRRCGFDTLHGDFLKQKIFDKQVYDHAVAVPPYKDNVDCQHIIAMYDCVKPGGTVIAFTLPTWVTGMYSNQIAFRKWLSNKNYVIKIFEDEESYVSCPKMLLIIKK